MRNIKINHLIPFLVFAFLINWQIIAAQDIRIGLFEDRHVGTFTIHCIKGRYEVLFSGKNILLMQTGDLLYVSLIEGRISIHDGKENYGFYDNLIFNDLYKDGEFRIKVVDPPEDSRNYGGSLEVNIYDSVLKLINQLSLDNYLAGVVHAEDESETLREYYKALSVISRTYALKNWCKHERQNFNLCDDAHCQIYKGIRDENGIITESVLSTHNIVMYNKNYKLITTPLHLNSGGETQRSYESVIPAEHLQAVIDPFSLRQKNSVWSKNISADEWRRYIFSHYTGDTTKISDDSLIIHQTHRLKYFVLGKDSLLITDIRKDMGLPSAFFNMEIKGDSVIIDGKGHGHGIGLSMEGAMEMSRNGYSFYDILSFYYHNIRISDFSDLPKSELPESFR